MQPEATTTDEEQPPVTELELRQTHVPRRPEWTCRRCEQDWPCRVQRAHLILLFDGVAGASLMRYMAVYLAEAHQDRPEISELDLAKRFLAWCPVEPEARETTHPPEWRQGRV
ncbi:hypothetical protein GCM10027605_18170 [Micromonospora zhanjiangensis]